MSLQAAAQHLASKGRGPDTHLVHMAPSEVAGLQALAMAHGGSLTLNPHTGLPEAGFLSSLLPMVIGAGLAAATGGTSLALTPGMIGLGVGGLETLRTGSLSKGLMAGLGAFGGAGLAGGLMGAGVGAAQQAAIAGAGEGATQAAMNQAAANATTQALASPATTMGQGISALGTEAGRSAAMQSLGGGAQAAKYGLAAAAPAMMEMPQTTTPQGSGPNPYEYTYDPNTQRYTRVPVGTRQRDVLQPIQTMSQSEQSVRSMFRPKSVLNMGANAIADQFFPRTTATSYEPDPNQPYGYQFDPTTGQYTRVPTGTRDAMPTTTPMFMAAGGPVDEMSARNAAMTLMADGGQMFAHGGMTHLGDYSDGGRLLRGPGDGVSDSIPATIADKRPARLADGEFVVPARIVSELGNGSTDAGARKLYAMMDRIQKSRGKTVGKGRMAVDSRADKALPA